MMNAMRGLMGFAVSSVSWTNSISSQLGLYYIRERMIDIGIKAEMSWNYFYKEILPLILEKFCRYFCILIGIYFGLLYVSTVITPYHITENHFFVLSMQQNIAYIWYLIPGEINLR